MNYKDYTKRLSYLLHMIEKGQMTSLPEVAKQFECSERTVRRMINVLRDAGHDIKYSRHSHKYLLTKK